MWTGSRDWRWERTVISRNRLISGSYSPESRLFSGGLCIAGKGFHDAAGDDPGRGALIIEPEKRKVTAQGRPVHLTAREFELLLEFARNPGRVYTRAQLLDKVWGYSYQGYEHTVNSHINRLREKIEGNPAKPRYILTIRGVGYRFAEPGDREKGMKSGSWEPPFRR